jgi:proteasome assembly chaperone (PAC2) family protein
VETVRWDERPDLHRPVLVAAFEGWNDAGDAATMAARWLRDHFRARRFASLDPEEFYDFSSTRPQVRLVGGVTRRIEWPANELWAAGVPDSDRDVAVLLGVEPQLRWRTFCQQVVSVAAELGVELVVTLGALLAEVAHTRPVQVTGTAADPELVRRLGLARSTYEGPTGIVGVLHDTLGRAGTPSASLWAAVPHYVAGTPSPKAALALVQRTSRLLGLELPTAELQGAAATYERSVTEVVAGDDDVSAYVARLEESADSEGLEMTSGEDLAAELQRFLREQGDS